MKGPVVAGIQARMSSTRLPAKMLADLHGVPLFLRVVERVRAARHVDEVVLLTSVEASDDPLAEACEAHGVACQRGPLADVMARYEALCDAFDPAYVARVTGDCPFVSPEFLDRQVEALRAFDGDLVRIVGGNEGLEGVLGGQTVTSQRALRLAAGSEDPLDREHVGSFFFQRALDRLRVVGLEVDASYRRPDLRLAVDEADDLRFVRRLLASTGSVPGSPVALERVLASLDADPGLARLNAEVRESAANRELRTITRSTEPSPVGVYR